MMYRRSVAPIITGLGVIFVVATGLLTACDSESSRGGSGAGGTASTSGSGTTDASSTSSTCGACPKFTGFCPGDGCCCPDYCGGYTGSECLACCSSQQLFFADYDTCVALACNPSSDEACAELSASDCVTCCEDLHYREYELLTLLQVEDCGCAAGAPCLDICATSDTCDFASTDCLACAKNAAAAGDACSQHADDVCAQRMDCEAYLSCFGGCFGAGAGGRGGMGAGGR